MYRSPFDRRTKRLSDDPQPADAISLPWFHALSVIDARSSSAGVPDAIGVTVGEGVFSGGTAVALGVLTGSVGEGVSAICVAVDGSVVVGSIPVNDGSDGSVVVGSVPVNDESDESEYEAVAVGSKGYVGEEAFVVVSCIAGVVGGI